MEAQAKVDSDRDYQGLAEACNKDPRFTEKSWSETSASIQRILRKLEFRRNLRYLKDPVAAVFRVRDDERRRPRRRLSQTKRQALERLRKELAAEKAEESQLRQKVADQLELWLLRVVNRFLASHERRIPGV